MTNRVLLIDADVLAFQAASLIEKAVEWEPGYWTWSCDFEAVVDKFDSLLAAVVDHFGGTPTLCLTDSEGNFRFSVLPTYKGNRAGVKKPLVLKAFKQFLIENRGAYFKSGLEGDDVMGILMTRSNPTKEERIIVSLDKDMKTVPGLVCRWPIEKEARLISEDEADYWHLFQTLTGDTTDGYKGCPGMGAVGAAKVLDADPSWATVVKAFEKAKLGEQEALTQARVARILRASDYDFKTRSPLLWTPS